MFVRSSSFLSDGRNVNLRPGCRKRSDVQSTCGGGIELVTKFGGGTGRFRFRTRSKQASDKRTRVRKTSAHDIHIDTVWAYETWMLE